LKLDSQTQSCTILCRKWLLPTSIIGPTKSIFLSAIFPTDCTNQEDRNRQGTADNERIAATREDRQEKKKLPMFSAK